MARIGSLSIGGRGTRPDAPPVFGVAFELSGEPKSDFLYTDGAWQVELRAGQRSIVARTGAGRDRSAMLATGIEYAQRALDILSFETRVSVILANLGDTHVVLFPRDGALVLQHVDVSTLGMGVEATATVTAKDGNIKETPVQPPEWTAGLRFYRLSQASRNLYDKRAGTRLAAESAFHYRPSRRTTGACPEDRGRPGRVHCWHTVRSDSCSPLPCQTVKRPQNA
jgi:hypothetical protein